MDPKTYRIEKVSDFLQVPEERLPACLMEFIGCLELVHEAERKNCARASLAAFTWIDDGKFEIDADIDLGVECSCCHQLVGLSQVTLQNGQELCSACVSEVQA